MCRTAWTTAFGLCSYSSQSQREAAERPASRTYVKMAVMEVSAQLAN